MRCRLMQVALLSLPFPTLAAAQSVEARRPSWEVTPQVGFFVPEEPRGAEIEAGPFFGARAGYHRAAGLGIEAHAGYTPLELEASGNPSEAFEMPTFLYGADLLYSWVVDPRADFFLSTGAGGITWSPDREGEDEGVESNFRVTFGAGVRYLIGSSVAVRGDVRDHIVFDQLADTARSLALVDRGNTNNLEGSLGVSVVLR